VSENDLKRIFDEDVKEKLIGNPLKRFLRQLGSLYIQRSQQELNRTAQKEKVAREIREQRRLVVTLKPVEPAVSQPSSEPHSTASVYPRYPSTLPSTPQKRNASEASLDPQSTHTTPKKLVKAEAVIQNLQNILVLDIFDGLFDDIGMEIKWARGRKMRLLYAEYNYHLLSAECRTNPTSFACRLAGNSTEKDDRVKAISDGALYLVTDKLFDRTKSCCWSRQYAVLSFEVTQPENPLMSG